MTFDANSYLSSLKDSAGRIVQDTGEILANILDTAPSLPTPPNPLVPKLMLDQAVAATTAATTAQPTDTVLPQNMTDTLRSLANADLNSSTVSGTIGKSVTVSGASAPSAAGQQMLTSFESAFPDRKFSLTEKDGQITVEDVGAKSATAGIVSNVPIGYNPDNAAKGLNDLQAQLARETDPKKQLDIAYQLKSAVAIQSAAKYQQYVNQANAENQIPTLEAALAQSRQLDMQSPTVRASGMMSKQTFELLQELSQARRVSAMRTNDLVRTDPALGAADSLATLTIQKLDKSLQLDQHQLIVDQKTRAQQERQASILDLKANPTLLNRVALMKSGQPLTPGTEDVLAGQIADHKIHLDPVEQMIVQLPPEDLAKTYMQSTDPKLRAKLSPVMIYEEAKGLQGQTNGRPEGSVALERARVFKALMDTPMNAPAMKPYNQQYQADLLQANMQTGVAKAKAQNDASVAAHLRYIDDYVKQTEQADVRPWNGAIKSDTTAAAVLKQYGDAKPGKPVPMKEFVTNYLNYNDGKNKADKITALRTLVSSHVDSIPQSVYFPKPSVTAFTSEVDRLAASSFFDTTILSTAINAGDAIHRQLFGGNQ